MQQTATNMQRGASAPHPAEEAPLLLGRYRVLETNHTGGFGTVSVCWDPRLQRRVAIKRMPLRLGPNSPAIASTVEEALAEARTSSMLTHPNIVHMYDFERDDRFSYLVMEYVDGLSLADLISRVEGGVLVFDECAHLVDSVASALAYAHENGVLHLDIKPENILIDRSGTIKLGDFGMASLASAAGYGGARGGTVGYMPPEQIEGDYVDERTDVFSLAVVVWEALTGSCPYAASTPEESLNLIRRGPSPALSRIEPELAGVVEETLLRALDPSPATRTASVETFARDLVRALGDPQEGAESLRDLLNQTESAEDPEAELAQARARVPVSLRFPWLGEVATRILSAVTAGWAASVAIPLLLPDVPTALPLGVAGAAAASAAWPPMGGFLGITSLVASLCAIPSRMAVPLGLLVAALGFAWWIAVGRRFHLGGTALLLPSCTGSPFAGVGLCGFSLAPGSALVTGAAGWLMWLVFQTAARQGFEAETLAASLQAALVRPDAWLSMAGCAVGALLCAVATRRGGIVWPIVGQVLAVAILFLSQYVCISMENGDIASALDLPSLGIAVTLGATLSIVTILMGGHVHDPEGYDRT